MSCDELYHRHFHKKITHVHLHVEDEHHHHTHEKIGVKAIVAHEDGEERHLHEHTHEAFEHEHPVEHDPLHSHHSTGLAVKQDPSPESAKSTRP